MIKFLGRRLAASILIMAIAGTVVFFSIHLLPGDPVLILLGEQGANNPEVVARIRAQLNLDVSLPQQFWLWLNGLASGDLGKSLENGLPVFEVISQRIPRSLEIIIVGLAIATTLGIPLGTTAARHRKHFQGTLASALAVVGFSSPVFVTGIVAQTAAFIGLYRLLGRPAAAYLVSVHAGPGDRDQFYGRCNAGFPCQPERYFAP
jgi:peptide/nickel transport system permease protein